MKRNLSFVFVLSGISWMTACSSTSTVKVNVEEPDFKVLEAAPGGRESWLDSPQSFASEKGLDTKQNYFYTGESRSPDKRMACEKAQSHLQDDIAKQVATFTDSVLARATSESSQSDSQSSGGATVSEETQKVSTQLARTQLSNVLVNKTYWERRDYSQNGGPKNMYLCWVFASISKQQVNNIVNKATTVRLASNPELKAAAGKAVENIDIKYEEWQKSH